MAGIILAKGGVMILFPRWIGQHNDRRFDDAGQRRDMEKSPLSTGSNGSPGYTLFLIIEYCPPL
jgi:hypothetical protein